MAYLVVCAVALLVSALTLFSGFGLGTLLMPAFALFFPVPVAVAATAVVRLSNNIFKVGLVGRKADMKVVFRFALPAALAAMVGAWLLTRIADMPPLAWYHLGGQAHEVTVAKVVIGLVIVGFALLDLLPRFSNLAFDRKYLPIGGVVSGFFGGLSGNQGAMRSAFLIKSGLSKEAFIGTGTVSAVVVDAARLLVYGLSFYALRFADLDADIGGMVLAATLSAFLGAFIGSRMITKVTLHTIQMIVGAMLIAIGLGLATGIL